MAERPNQNWEARDYTSWGVNYSMNVRHPQMNGDGTTIFSYYGYTDEKDVNLQLFTSSGTYHQHNDRTIELIAGQKNTSGDVDIVIAGMNGDITITCLKNGNVRIKGSTIELEADEDINIKAGRNITLNGKNGRCLVKAKDVSVDGLMGNLVAATMGTFAQRVFDAPGIFVGPDFPGLKDAVKSIPVFGEPVASLF
jgi:hypothetical protein